MVSPRQRGNPVLTALRSLPWEYSDIPADYGLGLTTCALFLSLKYHRLHPEYIHTRVEGIKNAYNLRILLLMCDIVRLSSLAHCLDLRTYVLYSLSIKTPYAS